jgi:hypothetical protein
MVYTDGKSTIDSKKITICLGARCLLQARKKGVRFWNSTKNHAPAKLRDHSSNRTTDGAIAEYSTDSSSGW